MNGLREHFRIRYPERDRAWLAVGEFVLPVLDLSESGAGLPTSDLFQEGQGSQEISIAFSDGGEFLSSAVFVRSNSERTGIRFLRMVPLGRILKEQRRLNERFLHVY